jgi:hypothetical protein
LAADEKNGELTKSNEKGRGRETYELLPFAPERAETCGIAEVI